MYQIDYPKGLIDTAVPEEGRVNLEIVDDYSPMSNFRRYTAEPHAVR